MSDKNSGLDTLKDIRQMMERSSRFISLSGLSGIAAGICALIGAWFAFDIIISSSGHRDYNNYYPDIISLKQFMEYKLFRIALFTLIAAFILALIFTWIKSKKNNVPIWGTSSKRLLWNMAVPLVAGGFFLLRMIQLGYFGMIAPGCLIFYGIALINASKYTLGEVRYLGYCQVILGLINCWFLGYGLYFWTIGFGVLHIIYGVMMWWKYERKS
ncbi:hypothetical protein DC498_12125 [Terrimonas sp.]|uniref:hypothetical protein n=1 Tax=Terrimonas sp. TaxID=1914338 RepID=UPI000D50E637|nr:hypothetical protein [Terrimonas sp.]PVD52125.1 hypothetical protein DC498_12125 [Terrimonas sp.]